MRSHERLNFRGLETTARQQESFRTTSPTATRSPFSRSPDTSRARLEAGDDTIDVGFNVDAGFILEIALSVGGRRQGPEQPLPHFGVHDLLHVRCGNHAGV